MSEMQHMIDAESPFNVQFSSGTTGKPKAAVGSHFSNVNNGINIGEFSQLFNMDGSINKVFIYLGIRQGLDQNYRRVCLNNPFFHAYGLTIAIINNLYHGSTLIVPEKHFSPSMSLQKIVSEKCDVIYGTPTSKSNEVQ